MRISVCVTTFNEEKTIGTLLKSLTDQTKKPDEIIVVDGGSTDATVTQISKLKSKNHISNLRIIKTEQANIAMGRNLAIKNARNEIIAMTDAGCVADKKWLEEITRPFGPPNRKNASRAEVVAGFYKMTTNSPFQKSLANFLGTMPEKFNEKFLPSTRSIAFTKDIWQKVGGFNENLTTAEDTDFNYKLALAQARIV
ncbi:MAG: glycosyltransferase, partial [Patescibacteria group bacterium]